MAERVDKQIRPGALGSTSHFWRFASTLMVRLFVHVGSNGLLSMTSHTAVVMAVRVTDHIQRQAAKK